LFSIPNNIFKETKTNISNRSMTNEDAREKKTIAHFLETTKL